MRRVGLSGVSGDAERMLVGEDERSLLGVGERLLSEGDERLVSMDDERLLVVEVGVEALLLSVDEVLSCGDVLFLAGVLFRVVVGWLGFCVLVVIVLSMVISVFISASE